MQEGKKLRAKRKKPTPEILVFRLGFRARNIILKLTPLTAVLTENKLKFGNETIHSFINSFYFAINWKYNSSMQKYIKDNIQYSN